MVRMFVNCMQQRKEGKVDLIALPPLRLSLRGNPQPISVRLSISSEVGEPDGVDLLLLSPWSSLLSRLFTKDIHGVSNVKASR